MDFKEVFLEAVSTLTLNKLRTGLAILGIIIGIGSVIALVSLGQGSQKQVENQIESLGANLLTVVPSGQFSSGVRQAPTSSTSLTLSDAEAIKEKLATLVNSVSPEYSSRAQAIAGRNNTNTQIVGVTPQYALVRKIELSSGNFISDLDVNSLNKVAVLGPTVSSDMFGDNVNPVGQNIRVKNLSLRVIGITKEKGGTGFNNQDDVIYVPLTTAQKQIFGATSLTSIAVEAKSQDIMLEAQNEIGYLLMERHKLSDLTNVDFSIFSQNDILQTASQVTGTFTALLGGIAAISLLVGGIGIMNIMLVTVTERTREIGLRKALGAKKKTIITQFLTEAIMLTISGGLIGMIVGAGISFILSKSLGLPFTISFESTALAIGVSGIVGILFGWYPARKAANLQPIEALRYE